jgi:hypothetical protein
MDREATMNDDDDVRKEVVTTDLDAAAFLAASGFVFLRCEAVATRAQFVFRDSRRGSGARALFAFYKDHFTRRVFSQKKILRRSVDLAKTAPSRTCTAAELEAHLAAWGSAQERPHESTRSE